MRVRVWPKPAGVPVFPSPARPEAPHVLGRLLASEPWRATVAWPAAFAGGIAHRLDNATSGALLVADDLDALAAVRARFQAGALTKTYWFEARHDVPWDAHDIDLPLAHDPRHKARMVVRRGLDTPHRGPWLPARTTLQRRGARLWEATMRTGVMHQIRLHAAFVGLALRGDRLYGGGPPLDDAVAFHLHHVGVRDDDGWTSAPVQRPSWISLTSG